MGVKGDISDTWNSIRDYQDVVKNPPPPGCYFEVMLFHFGVLPSPLDFRFRKVSGMSNEIKTTDLKVGGQNRTMVRLPEAVTHGNLILERGLVNGSALNWELNTAMSTFQFFPGNIFVLLQEFGNKGFGGAWLFRNTYPVAWKVSDLNSDKNDVVIEKMEFAYSHFHIMRY